MGVANFIQFARYFDVFKDQIIYGDIDTTKVESHYGDEDGGDKVSIEERRERRLQFLGHIKNTLKEAKIFEIDDDIKKMLILSNPPKYKNEELHLPFEHIFLDVNFEKEELDEADESLEQERVVGIMFAKGNIMTSEGEVVGNGLRMSTLSQKGTEYWFDTFNSNINMENPDYSNDNVSIRNIDGNKKLKEFIHRFILNFLNFINNPEIVIKEQVRSEANQERRRKKGKTVISSSFSIKLTGKLYQYATELSNHADFHYGYRFFVRGHFREYRDGRYKNKKGMRQFILPYIKGKGILMDKSYVVEDKKPLKDFKEEEDTMGNDSEK